MLKSMKKSLSDTILGASFFVLGVSTFLYSRTFPTLPDGVIGPGLFPMVISGVMTILGLYLVLCSLKLRKSVAETKNIPHSKFELKLKMKGLIVPLAVLAYILLVEQLGFLMTTWALNFILFLIFKVKLIKAVLISVVATLTIYYLFAILLSVPLPTLF